MARIPQFTQQRLASSVRTAAIQPSAITAAAAPFRAFAGAAETIADVSTTIAERQIATQSAQFNSGLEVQAEQAFTNLTQSEEIKRDPTLLNSRLAQEFQKLKNSPQFQQQPSAIQNRALSRLTALEGQFGRRAVNFQAKQNLQNNINDLDRTQENYESLASNSDAPIDDLLLAYSKDLLPFGQALQDSAKMEEIQRNGSRDIVEQRINRFIEQSNFDGAKRLLSEKEYGEFFNAKERTKINDTIARAEKRAETILEKERARQVAVKSVADALESGTPIDAKNKENQKVINEFYDASGINDNLKRLDVGAANDVTDIAVRTNFIPEMAASTIRAQLTTGNTEQKAFAAEMISRLQEVAPRTLDTFSKRELEQATLSISYIRSGVAPGKAFDFAKEQTDVTNKPLMEARKAGLSDTLKKQDFAAQAEEALDPGFFTIGPSLPDAPIARDSIVADYRNIFEGFMLSTGDEDAARKLTEQEFTRFYGQTEITGDRRVMKYPPENFYSVPGLDNEWMSKQLQEDLKQITGSEPDLDDVVVIADSITAREAQPNGRPSYQVFIKGELGDFNEVRDADGNLLRYRFDPTNAIEEERRKLQQEQQEDLESAKRTRDRRLLEESIFTPDDRAAETVLRYRGLM